MQASYISFQYPKGRGQTCQARKPLPFHSSHLESSRIPPCVRGQEKQDRVEMKLVDCRGEQEDCADSAEKVGV